MTRPIPILMYHQIDASPPRGTPMRGLTVTPHRFSSQMALLHLLGYRGVSMTELEPYLRGEVSGKVVGITFDDGYQNNLQYALPVLQRHSFTATCYAVSALAEARNVWDEAMGVPQKPLFTPADMRSWVDAGMDLGSHTRHHADLTALDDEQARSEIIDSRHELQDITGQEVRHFCYPYGRYDARHRAMTKEAGYATATTTARGRTSTNDDLLALPRVLIAHSNHLLLFWAKTLHSYEDRYR
jgi:peptidoglycan/xylan/chitin deacetylase (PgdA/CDA1 family)